jgi:hypothetical protein
MGALREELRRRGTKVRVARKGVESSKRLGRRRWILESWLSWLMPHRHRTARGRSGLWRVDGLVSGGGDRCDDDGRLVPECQCRSGVWFWGAQALTLTVAIMPRSS